MVIVDSSVWIDYFNGVANPHTDWLDAQMEQQRLGLTAIILCEVLQGVWSERKAAAVEAELLKLEVFHAGDAALAAQAARYSRTLRGRGRTVRTTIDVLIATFCLQGKHSLLHRDRDFDPFEELLGLSVIHPPGA